MNNERASEDLRPEWVKIISRYNFPDPKKSWWQIANSVGSYILLWIGMIYSLKVSYWLTLLLAVFAAGFMIRIFIIFHDCGHGSFFRSKRMNKIIGVITGLIVFTPYSMWHHEHYIHHQTVGNLDKRGMGDVKTLTVEEYGQLTKFRRFGYRFYRNPVFLFVIAPLLIFVLQHRLTRKYMTVKEKLYHHLSSLTLGAVIFLLILAIGWKAYLFIQLPVLFFAAASGVWLFYVQHQFRHVQWTKTEGWEYKSIALTGSSLYKLPFLLNWFTGSIGYHHIHHLSPLIPNYKLRRCHNENALFKQIKPITFFSGFESLKLRLWDERRQMLIAFSEM